MHKLLAVLIASFFAITLSSCSSSDPGPLKGTWKMDGIMPMVITFRRGEIESMGIIEKVSYQVKGNDVLITYKDGMAKGTTFRYTMKNPDLAYSQLGSLRRVRN